VQTRQPPRSGGPPPRSPRQVPSSDQQRRSVHTVVAGLSLPLRRTPSRRARRSTHVDAPRRRSPREPAEPTMAAPKQWTTRTASRSSPRLFWVHRGRPLIREFGRPRPAPPSPHGYQSINPRHTEGPPSGIHGGPSARPGGRASQDSYTHGLSSSNQRVLLISIQHAVASKYGQAPHRPRPRHRSVRRYRLRRGPDRRVSRPPRPRQLPLGARWTQPRQARGGAGRPHRHRPAARGAGAGQGRHHRREVRARCGGVDEDADHDRWSVRPLRRPRCRCMRVRRHRLPRPHR